jgi:hypothetical protein
VVSRTFNVIYDGLALFPSITSAHPAGAVVPIGRRMTRPRDIVLVDRNNEQRKCIAEAFDTTHQIFVLIRDVGAVAKSVLLKPGSVDFNLAVSHLG